MHTTNLTHEQKNIMQRSDDYPLAVYAPIPTDHTPRTDADLKATLPGEQVCSTT
jgi:hypothetical protein